MDSDNELFILYFHHRGRRRLTSSFRHHCGTLNASSSLQIISKSTLVKKKTKWISCSISPTFTFTRQQKRCDHWKRCHPRQRQTPQQLAFEKRKTNTQAVTVFKGPKGINKRNAAFIFFPFFKRRTGCGEDGWMLSFSISIYRWLRCYVMLLQKKFPLYIYIYKLKIITLMQ